MNIITEQKLNTLIILMLEGKASEVQKESLFSILSESSEAVDHYMKSISMISCLVKANARLLSDSIDNTIVQDKQFDIDTWNAMAEVERTAVAVEIEKPVTEPVYKFIEIEKSKPSKLLIYTAIFSSAAMILLMLLVWIVPVSPPAVASLGYTVDAVWGQSTEVNVMGDDLEAGAYYLEKGLAQILFYNGAKAILEGPAVFELSSTSSMELTSGKVVANVNRAAAGFTVNTPSAKVLDLGTEFGVEVDLSGDSDIHVFDGEVVLYPENNGKKYSLLKGKAKNISTSGVEKDIELDGFAFVRQAEFNSNVKAQHGDPYNRWLSYSYQLRRDPSLVAYYTFEKDDQAPDILRNIASLTEGMLAGDLYSSIDGKLPTWTAGRWPQKTALNFDRSQEQVVIVPSDPALHINGPITIAAWIKCDEPDDGGHVVSCRLPGGMANYQFGYDAPDASDWAGNFQFGRMIAMGGSLWQDRIYSNRTFAPSAQWKFIAASHDNKEVRFYVDGRLIEAHEFEFFGESVIADMVIGADNVASDPSRFTGDIGELAIFKRVITAEEIGEMCKAGKP